jgi:hypothetical protein
MNKKRTMRILARAGMALCVFSGVVSIYPITLLVQHWDGVPLWAAITVIIIPFYATYRFISFYREDKRIK